MNNKEYYIIPDKKMWGGEWRSIIQSDNYAINEYGVFKSLKRKVLTARGTRIVNEKIIPWTISCKGYARVSISMGRDKKRVVKKVSVHRLVASVFCDDFDKYPQINHEDGNKLNNHYSNLKPCDAVYNQQHATRTGLNKNKESWEDSQSIPIIMVDKDGLQINRYGSMCEAARLTGLGRTSIRRSCDNLTGKRWGHPFNFKYLNKGESR